MARATNPTRETALTRVVLRRANAQVDIYSSIKRLE
jgi:hypothetical protein